MKAFLQRFMWRLLSAPVIHHVNWTRDERIAFDLFVRSTCGIKLFELLRQTVATKTFNAVCHDSVHANAEARGAQEIYALLHRLRNFPLEESEQYDGLVDQEPTTPEVAAAIDGRRHGWSGGSAI
jgi:hypothetical protein